MTLWKVYREVLVTQLIWRGKLHKVWRCQFEEKQAWRDLRQYYWII